MTNNPTIDGVSRELLARIAEHCKFWKDHAYIEAIGDIEPELRALLDAPAVERCTSCDDSGDLTDLTGEWRGYCTCPAGEALKNKPAVTPEVAALQSTIARLEARVAELESGRGEPVAWMTGPIVWGYKADANRHADAHGMTVIPLFTAPPAPVAVGLPDRKTFEPPAYMDRFAEGWNACLDATAALSKSP